MCQQEGDELGDLEALAERVEKALDIKRYGGRWAVANGADAYAIRAVLQRVRDIEKHLAERDAEVKRVVEEARSRYVRMQQAAEKETRDLNVGAAIACDEILRRLGIGGSDKG